MAPIRLATGPTRPSDDAFAFSEDADRLGRTTLSGEDDLLVVGGLGIDDDRDAVVVEVEDPGRPEAAVPRAHACVAVDLDPERHRETVPPRRRYYTRPASVRARVTSASALAGALPVVFEYASE